MLAHDRNADDWGLAHGGFRGSHLLLPGAVALGLGALLSLAGIGHADAASPLRASLVTIGWAAYVLGLILVGLGFAWTCLVGILHRSGVVTALFSLLQASYVLLALSRNTRPALDPAVISTVRLAALAAFALLAARAIGHRLALATAVTAGAGCLKAGARLLSRRHDGSLALDAALVLGLAVALTLLAARLRRLEDEWARRNRGDRRSDFSEFNNPQHRWNRPDDRTGLSCARSVS